MIETPSLRLIRTFSIIFFSILVYNCEMNSGIYNYFLNGEPTNVSETFDIKIMPGVSKLTTSIRNAKPFNTTITVETSELNNKFQTCNIIYQKDDTKVEAIYEFSETRFQIRRKINSEIVQDEKIIFPENAIFFPLMRCFQGQTILQVAENQDITTVIVPDIQPNTERQNLLKPTFDERTAKLISNKNNLRVFNYSSNHYDDNSEFHIDQNRLLAYYKFVQNEQQTWEIMLTP
jgi:hypothetical protein